ncbi:aldehyde dehydrogenase (NADP(+)) [Pseudomonas sp. 21LCFQ02]|uniref:aldehyde dehydrogenase (NADP(+)) n=1 Tax=Pseudomonas sp. 21LCFQ02 TaxID=2957505 RepID=UPI00209BA023|nr:aldehyde dehydrogenase (NADP(+)) [Pseudomonas sp. 21LCFQ02]MCO8170860.1 aldehyde dehydrogenase (NADP(+)) [Pseudomonas sp. 21LCFQ02]
MAANNSPELQQIDQVVAASAATAELWATSTPALRAALLDGLAQALEAHQAELVALADAETHLGAGRLNGEVARTAFQLRGFATEVRNGVPYAVVDDEAIAGAPPAGRPRLTRVSEPLGPVAMFSASNFPFAFSVLGGDTASALAAGCPVVVKAHSGHPQLSRAVFDIAQGVLKAQSLPAGLIGLVDGASRAAGTYLVQHPQIAAVAFTGSFGGGTALWRAANERPVPVPFFGELGSINPLVALPHVLERDGESLAKTLAGSITMGCGQFCTSPGVIVLLPGAASDRFVDHLATALQPLSTHAMLTDGMRKGFEHGVAQLEQAAETRALFQPAADTQGPAPRLFEVSGQAFIDNVHLREEVFGPAAVVVRAASVEQINQVLEAIGGTLTATLWGFEQADEQARTIYRTARKIAGRVLFGGVPTGVAVTAAQQHGGPWPASTQPQTTSVGYAALQRFLRPVALQDAPAWVVGN